MNTLPLDLLELVATFGSGSVVNLGLACGVELDYKRFHFTSLNPIEKNHLIVKYDLDDCLDWSPMTKYITPFMITCSSIKVMKALYAKYGKDCFTHDFYVSGYENILSNACRHDCFEILEWVISVKKPYSYNYVNTNYPHIIGKFSKWMFMDIFRYTPYRVLRICLIFGYINQFDWLLAERYDTVVDTVKRNVARLMKVACKHGNLGFLKWVNEHVMVSRVCVTSNNNFMFRAACRNNHLEVAQWLYYTFCLSKCDITANDYESMRCNANSDVKNWVGVIYVNQGVPRKLVHALRYKL